MIKVTILIGEIGFGGQERQLFNFLKYADKSSFCFDLLVLNKRNIATYDAAIQALGIGIHYCPPSQRSVVARMRWVAKMLRTIRPALIHSWAFYTNPYAGLAGMLAGVPARVGSLRTHPALETELPALYRLLGYRIVQSLVVNSQSAIEAIKSRKLRRHRISLVNNGIETPPARAPLDLSAYDIHSETPVAAAIGNIHPRKNHRMFVEALRSVVEKHPNIRALIVGQPLTGQEALVETLKQQIESAGLTGKVFLTGPRTDVPQLMQRLSILCHTSYFEGTSNVILEAMAAGCPVVTTPAGDAPYFIENGQNGFLVPMEDSAAMANVMCRMLENPDLARQIGQAGLQTVRDRFSCDRMARGMEEVYRITLQGVQRTSP